MLVFFLFSDEKYQNVPASHTFAFRIPFQEARERACVILCVYASWLAVAGDTCKREHQGPTRAPTVTYTKTNVLY